MADVTFVQTIQHNCDISDARDNGIYSICTLVLKLRNLYKWEHNIEPWEEPESADLLDWIEVKENYWETIAEKDFLRLSINGNDVDPYDLVTVNKTLKEPGLVYGAGYGRSMKSVFFLAEKIDEYTVEGCPVQVFGTEMAKELSSPFAMLQDGTIIIRREPLRFFFWDHIQEIRSSSKASLHHALAQYGILSDGQLDQDQFRAKLDYLVDQEIPIFIYHEVGEKLQKTLDSKTLKRIISVFPDSIFELVGRSLKDVLADTHPQGMVRFIIEEQREASLGFYVGFLAGLRKELFPDIIRVFDQFVQTNDWQLIEQARVNCRERNCRLAEKMAEIADYLGHETPEEVQLRLSEEILAPLGLESPT